MTFNEILIMGQRANSSLVMFWMPGGASIIRELYYNVYTFLEGSVVLVLGVSNNMCGEMSCLTEICTLSALLLVFSCDRQFKVLIYPNGRLQFSA